MLRIFVLLSVMLFILPLHRAQALSLGPDEFAAAQIMTCILARESLGYINEKEYAALTEAVLGEFETEQSDVVYAKALGYFDGLMFGISPTDVSSISERLRSYVVNRGCQSSEVVNYVF